MIPLKKPFSKHEGHKGHKVFKTLHKFRHFSCIRSVVNAAEFKHQAREKVRLHPAGWHDKLQPNSRVHPVFVGAKL